MRGKDGVRWDFVLLVMFLFLCCVSSTADLEGSVDHSGFSDMRRNEKVNQNAGTPHGPIAIDGDANFSDTALAEGWPGDGSSGNPYIINGLEINLGGAAGHCINITNIRVNFTISNCNLTSASANPGAGIYLENVTYGEIVGNIFDDNVFNIYLTASHSVLVKENLCPNSVYSICLRDSSSNNIITDNNCSYNSNRGINLESSSHHNTIINNTCTNNVYGIVLYRVTYNDVANNTFNNNNQGIHSNDADFNTYTNNTCNDNSAVGIYLFNISDSNTIANNTCSSNNNYGICLVGMGSNTVFNNTCNYNNRGIYLYYTTSITIINNACNNNTHSGIYLDGGSYFLTIVNNTCNYNNWGIYVWMDTLSNTIINNTCNNNTHSGIYLSLSHSNALSNNTCNSNTYSGIYLLYSRSNALSNNTCKNNDYGIYLTGMDSNTVFNNTCTSNNWGIYLDGSNSNTVANNTFNDCGMFVMGSLTSCRQSLVTGNVVNTLPLVFLQDQVGGFVSSSAGQVILVNCSQITVQDQTLNDCSLGILLCYTDLATIVNNTCTNNEYGIYVGPGSNSSDILWNVFMNNAVNALDNALENIFDYNYWSDYTGRDADENGVGDTPYTFSGNQDQHPLMAPPGSLPFWLESPIDQVVILGEVFLYDLNASVYGGIDHWWINDTVNFAVNQSGVVTNITLLLAENYGIQVFANDTNGNILTGAFTVIVEDWFIPVWLELPSDQLGECGVTLQYDLNATDPSGLDTWLLNDTLHFAIDYDGQLSTVGIVPVGVYGVQVWVNDTWGNTLTGLFTVTVVDTLAPTWVEQPQNQIIEYGTTFICDLDAIDPSGIDEWWVDDTVHFVIDWLGQVRTIGVLEPGTYGLRVFVNDIYGHILSVAITVEVTTATTTTTTTSTTATTTTTTSTSVGEMDPLLALGLGAGIGGVAVVIVVIVLLRRKS